MPGLIYVDSFKLQESFNIHVIIAIRGIMCFQTQTIEYQHLLCLKRDKRNALQYHIYRVNTEQTRSFPSDLFKRRFNAKVTAVRITAS